VIVSREHESTSLFKSAAWVIDELRLSEEDFFLSPRCYYLVTIAMVDLKESVRSL
jgi:hypothetical protein